MVSALASHQCGPGSNPGVNAICGLSLWLVLSLAPRGFSPGTPVFPLSSKTNISKFQFDQDVENLELNILVNMTLNNWIWFYYQVIWGGRWQDEGAASTGEEVEQINSHMSWCGNTTKYMLPESKCFATHGLLFGNSTNPDRRKFKKWIG